jgi:hypothetical protein
MFFTSGNSSCQTHICSHYSLYQQHCKENNIPKNHHAIPQDIWREMKAAKTKSEEKHQVKLNGMLEKQPQEFTCDGVMEAVAKFVACDD